jgi:DMSO/TMAO reductase YedYZ heme-binding membrane subunit
VFLLATLAFGTVISGRIAPKGGARRWFNDLHPYLGGLSVLFVGLHVFAVMADTTIGFGPLQALVPFTSTWRPVAVAWGVIGVWLLGAVMVSSWARRRLARRTWHRIHLTSYALAAVVTLHGLTAGTDTSDRTLAFVGTAMLLGAAGLVARRALSTPVTAAASRVPSRHALPTSR